MLAGTSALAVTHPAWHPELWAMCFGGAAWLLAHGGYYSRRLTLSVLDDLPGLTGRLAAASGAALSVGAAFCGPTSSTQAVRWLAFGAIWAALVLLCRCGAYALLRRCRRRGWLEHPTLVLGAGRVGGLLADLLTEHRDYGLRPVGFIDSDPLLTAAERPLPVLGGTHDLSRLVHELAISDVVVAFGALPEADLVEVLRVCDRQHVEIYCVPRLFELQHTTRTMDHVWGVPLVRLQRAPFRSATWPLKRCMDVLVAGAALVLLLPVLLLCALAVHLDSGPHVLFRQQRVCLDGRFFELLKFRSLRPADAEESATLWNVDRDRRLTPVGRFLRVTSLDELPQLWNILRGDMSLVGPRPERPHFSEQFAATTPRYAARQRVPAGLTGWAQIHDLRGDTSIADRARFDNYYIENWSLWLDVKILLRTVLIPLAPRAAAARAHGSARYRSCAPHEVAGDGAHRRQAER